MRSERRQTRLWTSGAVFGLAMIAGVSGCKSNQAANTAAPIIDANGGADPAAVNNAPVGEGAPGATTGGPVTYARSGPGTSRQPARVLGQQAYGPPPASSGEQYPEQTGAGYPGAQGQPYPAGGDDSTGDYNAAYDQQIDAGQQALYADQAPPPLPVYQQPELTDPGDQWTPGYWNYASQGYYWVPGAWVAPPFIGALWTPGYWGFYGGRYRFNHGYWGHHIGFYGGVPYGFGYTGRGYEGGYWNGNRFYYNNSVNRVNTNEVHNVYVRNVAETNNRTSFNGPGGWNARPTASDAAVLHEQRVPAMQIQRQRVQEAASNRQQFAADNHGRPAMAALAEHQPADRVAPTAMTPVGRPAQAGGSGAVNGGAHIPQDQGHGQAGFNARGSQPQPGEAGRPAQPEQTRPGNQLRQPAAEARTAPTQNQPQMQEQQQRQAQEQQRAAQNQQQRPVQNQQQRPVQNQQQRPVQNQQQRPVQQQQQQRPVQQQARPEARPEPQPQARPQIQPQARPEIQPQARPEVQPQARPEVQAQPRPQIQPQVQPRAQPVPQPRAQPQQARPQTAPHAEEPHPHL